MSDEINLTEDNFDLEVLESKIPVLVDFWAEWCGPCKRLGPVVEELSNEYSGKVKITKINVDSAPGIASRYGISGIPALYLFNNGSVVENNGRRSAEREIKEMLDKQL